MKYGVKKKTVTEFRKKRKAQMIKDEAKRKYHIAKRKEVS